jgi:hypothetical protein
MNPSKFNNLVRNLLVEKNYQSMFLLNNNRNSLYNKLIKSLVEPQEEVQGNEKGVIFVY